MTRAAELREWAESLPSEKRRVMVAHATRIIWSSLRDNLIAERGRCERCGSTQRLEVSHTVPKTRGGNWRKENIELLCHDCHMMHHHHLALGFAP